MKKFLDKKAGFKNISVILLLFVFTIGITPKKTLHNWFANHRDTTSTTPGNKSLQLTKAGFNCSVDDLVAESHFVTFSSLLVLNLPSVHSFVSFYVPSFISLSLLHNNLRGPPLNF